MMTVRVGMRKLLLPKLCKVLRTPQETALLKAFVQWAMLVLVAELFSTLALHLPKLARPAALIATTWNGHRSLGLRHKDRIVHSLNLAHPPLTLEHLYSRQITSWEQVPLWDQALITQA